MGMHHSRWEPADLLPLRVIQHRRVDGVVIPDIDEIAAAKTVCPHTRPDPQDLLRLQNAVQQTGLVPGLRDQAPAVEVHRSIPGVLQFHIFLRLVDRDHLHRACARGGRRGVCVRGERGGGLRGGNGSQRRRGCRCRRAGSGRQRAGSNQAREGGRVKVEQSGRRSLYPCTGRNEDVRGICRRTAQPLGK